MSAKRAAEETKEAVKKVKTLPADEEAVAEEEDIDDEGEEGDEEEEDDEEGVSF